MSLDAPREDIKNVDSPIEEWEDANMLKKDNVKISQLKDIGKDIVILNHIKNAIENS